MNYIDIKNNRIIYFLEKFNSDNLGIYFSFFLHFLILISAIGLPNFFGPKEIYVPTIIPIEIVNVSDVTSIPKKEMDTKPKIEKKVITKEKKFNSSDNQEIRKIDIKQKPLMKENNTERKIFPKKIEKKVFEEKKELPLELEKQKIELNTNNFESLPTKKIQPKLKPVNSNKQLVKSKRSDILLETKPKLKPQPEFNIASMLKDLRNEKTTKKTESSIEDKNNNLVEKNQEDKNSESSQLSINEIDLVLQQLSRCFIAPAGAEIKKTMFVKISAKIQRNREVYENSIRIVDTNISKSSSVYGPITESATRTLLNPECIPLKLPEEKYDLWKNLTMKFDYSVMRGN